jgi:Tol biopolymer transport system component
MTQILSPTLDHLAAAWSPVAGSRRSHGRYSNSDPDFSPDGKSLLYASDRSGTADLWLLAWVLDLASGEVRQLTPTLFQPGRVSWS